MNFSKIEGTSNDFILTDELSSPSPEDAVRLCDRRRGVGGDGLILVLPSDKADFRMRIINSDGSEAQMCGNGMRCFYLFLERKMLVGPGTKVIVETLAGSIGVERADSERIRVDMGPPMLSAPKIPTTQTEGKVIDSPLTVEKHEYRITAVSMGNPHAVVFTDDLSDELVLGRGPAFERHSFFPERVNTEFIRVIGRSEMDMRVYERGAGETFACGTGACAAVVAGRLNGLVDKSVTVHLRGGDLTIEWDGNEESPVFLTGPARYVFDGCIEI